MKRPVRLSLSVLFLAALFVVLKECPTGNGTHSIRRPKLFSVADTLNCCIYVPEGTAGRIAFHYELLQRYAAARQIKLNYVPAKDTANIWNALVTKDIDVLVINMVRDSLPLFYRPLLTATPALTPMGEAWVTRKDTTSLYRDLYTWFNYFTQQSEYADFSYSHISGAKKKYPYDSLLYLAAKTLGWDWHLLRATVYQESHCKMNACSHKGAIGLMQLMPSTVRTFGQGNPYHPQENIQCATRYFAYLKRNMQLGRLPHQDQISFILAAYNAGMQRIMDIRDTAAHAGLDPNRWEEVKALAPKETRAYVEAIWERYQSWN